LTVTLSSGSVAPAVPESVVATAGHTGTGVARLSSHAALRVPGRSAADGTGLRLEGSVRSGVAARGALTMGGNDI
jgi:hypothetical protein